MANVEKNIRKGKDVQNNLIAWLILQRGICKGRTWEENKLKSLNSILSGCLVLNNNQLEEAREWSGKLSYKYFYSQ